MSVIEMFRQSTIDQYSSLFNFQLTESKLGDIVRYRSSAMVA